MGDAQFPAQDLLLVLVSQEFSEEFVLNSENGVSSRAWILSNGSHLLLNSSFDGRTGEVGSREESLPRDES